MTATKYAYGIHNTYSSLYSYVYAHMYLPSSGGSETNLTCENVEYYSSNTHYV